jgi:hypothetical protein
MDETATNQPDNRQLTTLLTLALVFLLTGIIVVYYFASQNGNMQGSDPTTQPSLPPTNTSTPPQFPPQGLNDQQVMELMFPATDADFIISSTGVTPQTATVKNGSHVKWVNSDEINHSVTVDSQASPVELNYLSEYTLYLSSTGTYNFTVSGFDDFIGTVTVE